MNLENYFISQFKSPYIGDDGAIIGDYVYSKDAFYENVHFKINWMSYYQIARKAMLVNISDAVAMNAKPKYALLSVAMPKTITKNNMRELAAGFKDVANEHNLEIIGGDTISNTKLDITVSIISKLNRKPLLRKGLKIGHLLAFTGKLGDSYKDLKKLLNNGFIHKNSKFVNIKLRDSFVFSSSRFLSAGMDISDGLFCDLDKLASTNNLGFKFNKQISKKVACSGEEYEMLISFSPRYKKTLIRRAKQNRVKINIFSKATRKKYINICKENHF